MASSANSLDRRLTARLVLAGLLVFASLAFALLFAAPAGAVVETIGTTQVGLQPRSEVVREPFVDLREKLPVGAEPTKFANPTGAPVLPSNNTYAIYWDPTAHYDGDWQQLIDTFFQDMGAASGSLDAVFSVDSQYTDAANQHASYSSTFQGAYTDTSAYPSAGCTDPSPMEAPDEITCLTDAQIRTALEEFIRSHDLPRGMQAIYYVLTPPGVTVCLDGGGPTGHCSDGVETNESYANSFCSYHSDINPSGSSTGDSSTILYAVVPWVAGGLGDYHLMPADRKPSGDECQDSGWEPTENGIRREEPKEVTKAELETIEKLPPEQKAEAEEALLKRLEREGPHPQEPNQLAGRSPDGSYDYGLADVIISQIGVEQQNIVTNPLLNAWQDPEHNEATDECLNNFLIAKLNGSGGALENTGAGSIYTQTLAGGNFYIKDAFNLAAVEMFYPGVPCLAGVNLAPSFDAPNPVNAGELVGFDGMESNISLDWGTQYTNGSPSPTYAVYKWNFGDGSPEVSGLAPGASFEDSSSAPCEGPWSAPCAASTFHSYQYGGKYEVTLTVTDTGGNVAQTSREITVVGPPAPSSKNSASSSATATAGQGAGGTSGGSRGARVYPAPVAYEAALSKSLRMALRHGLAVRYSVNEQVAGRFEVILSRRIAQRLHIFGPLASGLPKGTEPSIVIAHAVVVTTKAGHSTIRIKFSKSTASRLRKLRRVSLMLRMIVRNASAQNPLTATVLSTVPLD